MPPSDDSIDDSKPLRGKLRKGSDSSSLEEDEVAIGKLGKKPSGDDLVAIGQLTKRFGGSVGDIDRQVRGYLRKRQGATPSDQEVSRFIADLDKNPSDLEAIEGWIGEETLFRWLDQMRGQDEVRRFDFAVAVATLMCLRWLEVHDEESRAIAEFEEDNYESCLDPKNAIREWARFGLEELSDFIKAEVILGLQNAEGPEYAIYAARLVPGLQIFARLRPM
ncbi:hypothetical protein OAK43_03155, partial [Verrucomicrobiales bacterium]|nr:hypothetical protein [Verrucomicrobiales bacterium]